MREGHPIQLDYAPRMPWHRRVRWKRVTLVMLLAVLTGAGYRWGPTLWQRSRILYWQHRCATYAPPPDQLVYAEDPAGMQSLSGESKPTVLSSLPPRRGRPAVARNDPLAWMNLGKTRGLNVVIPWMEPGLVAPRLGVPEALVFLHERITKAGQRRIVAVYRMDESIGAGDERVHSYYRIILIVPDSWSEDPLRRQEYAVWADPAFPIAGPRGSREFGVASRGNLRFYAGQADPADASHFTLIYEVDGKGGTVDGRLMDQAGDAVVMLQGQP